MGQYIEMTGKTFGNLTVLERVGRDKNKDILWLCSCECGKDTIVPGKNLRSGNTKSCGCQRVIAQVKHGLSDTVLYRTWSNIKGRVLNKDNPDYPYYGGRGIKMCDRWLELENFIEDMSPTWKEGLTLDRVDNNGDYHKENCRWTTWSVQKHNRRKWKGCSSKTIGVSFRQKSGRFEVSICIERTSEYLGSFTNEVAAATAYDNRSEELYGDRPNGTERS